MKKLLLVLILLATAGSVFAADLKVTGDMTVRGTTVNNLELAKADEAQFSFFDYDLNLNLALIANENATVFTRLTFDKDVVNVGKVGFGDGTGYTASDELTNPTTPEKNAGLAVERAYLNYKFHPALQLNTGLMGGGQWATAFGDTEINVMRAQVIGALSADMVFIATYEKQDDKGVNAEATANLKDAEKDDTTVYYLSSRLKFGEITLLPLLAYGEKGVGNHGDYKSLLAATNAGVALAGIAAGSTKLNYKFTTMSATLGLNGDFGMFGFEAEGVYTKFDTDGFADDAAAIGKAKLTAVTGSADKAEVAMTFKDTKTFGMYLNLFAKIDPAKVGFVYAYGSADEKDGKYNWGDDLDLLTVMDDYVSNTNTGLAGFSVYKLYADATFGSITAGAAVAYGASNADYVSTANYASGAQATPKDASFTEIDASVSYAFDANASYTIAAGYAMTTDFKAIDTDANAYRVLHKFSVKF